MAGPGEVLIPNEIYYKRPGLYLYRDAVTSGLAINVGYPVGYVGNFQWGPEGEIITGVRPGSTDFYEYFDPGMDNLAGKAIAGIKNLNFPAIYLTRPVCTGTPPVMFTAALKSAGAVTVATLAGKYKGALPNNVYYKIEQVGATNSWYLYLKRGSRTEKFLIYLALKGATNYYPIDSAFCTLLWVADGADDGRPATVAAWTLLSAIAGATPGVDGVPAAADYLGVAGTGNAGVAIFETIPGICGVTWDDAPTLNDTIAAGFKVHTTKGFGRIAYTHGEYNDAYTDAKTQAAIYASERVVHTWPFVKQNPSSGVAAYEYAPPGPIAMCLQANAPCSRPLGWMGYAARKLQEHITGLAAYPSDDVLNDLKANGVAYMTSLATGGYGLGIDRTTSTSADINYQVTMTTRVYDYIGRYMDQACVLLETINAPHTRSMCDAERNALETKLIGMKEAAGNFQKSLTEECINDYEMLPYESYNGTTEEGLGLHVIGVKVKTAAQHEWTLLRIEIGSTVTVSTATV